MGRDDQQPVQRERGLGRLAGRQMPAMNGIERAAEHARRGPRVMPRATSVVAAAASGSCSASRASATGTQSASSSGGRPSPATAEILKNGSDRLLARCCSAVDAVGLVEGVELGGGDDLRLLQQRRIEQLELAADGVEVLDRVAARLARDVHQVDQHLRALDVAQELVAEPVPSCAPSMRPGTSATTKLRSSLRLTTPRWGVSVVKG